MQGLASQNAPSPKVVIPHFIAGGTFWLFTTLLLALFPDSLAGHFFNPHLLAMTHLLVLGWITMIIFGALYQLIPVILEVKLFSEKLAVISFVTLLFGVGLLAKSFWDFNFAHLFHLASGFLLISTILFATNIFLTAKHSEKKNIERLLILTSVFWLVFTALAGTTLGFNLSNPFLSQDHTELLKLHAHAGMLGWFLQLVIGVSSHLLPMFMLSEGLNKQKLTNSYWFLNFGLAGVLSSFFFESQLFLKIFGAVALIGVVFYLSFLLEAYQKRIKTFFDVGMQQSVLAFLFLLIPSILAVFLAGGFSFVEKVSIPLAIAYGTTFLVGFVSCLIMGQTYKTLPFIVWLAEYRSKVGKGKIPVPKDLYNERVAKLQFWIFICGFSILLCGILTNERTILQAGSSVLVVSVSLYLFNTLKIAFHKPKI